MTPIPPRRYSISDLDALPGSRETPVLPGYLGRAGIAGRIGKLTWVCTEDHDGQIEMSFSTRIKRPLDFEIKRLFDAVGWAPHSEESRKSGKIRHFVVQRGTRQ